MPPALAQEKFYTVNEIYELPEGERAELIDGQIYYMAPPARKHQYILNYLSTEINLYIRNNHGDCQIYPSPFAVFLDDSDYNYVEPDISVICDPAKLNDKGCKGAPDWIIEIVSPSSRQMDYYTKLFKYKSAGVREYWIVDPDKNCTTVYSFFHDDMLEYTFSDNIPVGIYQGFTISLSSLNIQ